MLEFGYMLFYETCNRKNTVSRTSTKEIAPKIPPKAFLEGIHCLAESEINKLKQNADHSSMQKYLIQCIQEVKLQNNNAMNRLIKIEDKIYSKPSNKIVKEIDEMVIVYDELIQQINFLLVIAWNSGNPSIIDALNFEKESSQKLLILAVGQPSPPTGLYAQLKHHL